MVLNNLINIKLGESMSIEYLTKWLRDNTLSEIQIFKHFFLAEFEKYLRNVL